MQIDYCVKQIQTDTEFACAKNIRQQVFVKEQAIPAELDEDGLDAEAIHVLAYSQNQAVATARLVINNDNTGVIARVAVLSAFRGQGHGKALVVELVKIANARKLKRLVLHPHRHLEKFYNDLGFNTLVGKTAVAGKHLLLTMEKIFQESVG